MFYYPLIHYGFPSSILKQPSFSFLFLFSKSTAFSHFFWSVLGFFVLSISKRASVLYLFFRQTSQYLFELFSLPYLSCMWKSKNQFHRVPRVGICTILYNLSSPSLILFLLSVLRLTLQIIYYLLPAFLIFIQFYYFCLQLLSSFSSRRYPLSIASVCQNLFLIIFLTFRRNLSFRSVDFKQLFLKWLHLNYFILSRQ